MCFNFISNNRGSKCHYGNGVVIACSAVVIGKCGKYYARISQEKT